MGGALKHRYTMRELLKNTLEAKNSQKCFKTKIYEDFFKGWPMPFLYVHLPGNDAGAMCHTVTQTGKSSASASESSKQNYIL